MTDNDIIKALECCGNQMYVCTDKQCRAKTLGNAVDLIKSQKAEIERLKKYNIEVAHKHYNDGIKEFAERLIENIPKSIDNYWNNNATGYYLTENVLDEINILVKEMIGDTE